MNRTSLQESYEDLIVLKETPNLSPVIPNILASMMRCTADWMQLKPGKRYIAIGSFDYSAKKYIWPLCWPRREMNPLHWRISKPWCLRNLLVRYGDYEKANAFIKKLSGQKLVKDATTVTENLARMTWESVMERVEEEKELTKDQERTLTHRWYRDSCDYPFISPPSAPQEPMTELLTQVAELCHISFDHAISKSKSPLTAAHVHIVRLTNTLPKAIWCL
jgi:hypothetical protein